MKDKELHQALNNYLDSIEENNNENIKNYMITIGIKGTGVRETKKDLSKNELERFIKKVEGISVLFIEGITKITLEGEI